LRRPDLGWNVWDLVSTIGAFLIALPCVVFLVDGVKTMRAAAPAGADPRDGRTLEWSIPSPPPPTVHDRAELWLRKHGDEARRRRPAEPAHPERFEPSTCYGYIWPLVMVAGARISVEPVVIGSLLTLYCTFGLEYRRRPSGDGMVPPAVHRTDVRGTEA